LFQALSSICPYAVAPITTEETTFLFIHDLVASVARPLMQLKSWSKIALAPGQSETVAFTLGADCFSFPDVNFNPLIEPGSFDILVGLNADPKTLLTIRLRALAR
jgi:beta-glucosidase